MSEASSNVESVRAYLAAAARRDESAMRAAFTDDVRYVVHGRGRLAGEGRGVAAVFSAFADLSRLSGGSYRIDEEVDWLTSEGRVLLVARESAERDGTRLEWTRLVLFTMRDGLIGAVDVFDDDQARQAEFWA